MTIFLQGPSRLRGGFGDKHGSRRWVYASRYQARAYQPPVIITSCLRVAQPVTLCSMKTKKR